MKEIMSGYYLRTVKLSDAKALYEFSKDPLVTKYLTWEPHQSIDDTIFAIKNHYFKNDPISYAITNKDDVAIGIIDFINNSKGKKEVGYFLNPKYQDLGIMTKALTKILDIGFNELGFEVIHIGHIDKNIASKKVILKNNFKQIEEVKRTIKNKTCNIINYEMKGTEFNE